MYGTNGDTSLCVCYGSVIFWAICGLLAAYLYGRRGRSGIVGFLGGFLLGPIGILLALVSSPDHEALARRERRIEERQIKKGLLKRCPHCGEAIKPEAKVCRYCGREWFEETPQIGAYQKERDSEREKRDTTNINELLKQGIVAAKAGNQTEAHRLLDQVVQADPQNETAWLWLSGVVKTDEQRIACLEKVLAVNPDNRMAQRGLNALRERLIAKPLSPSPSEEAPPFAEESTLTPTTPTVKQKVRKGRWPRWLEIAVYGGLPALIAFACLMGIFLWQSSLSRSGGSRQVRVSLTATAEPNTGWTNRTTYLWEAPLSNAGEAVELRASTKVKILDRARNEEEEREYYKVSHNGRVGYIDRQHVNLDGPPTPTPAPSPTPVPTKRPTPTKTPRPAPLGKRESPVPIGTPGASGNVGIVVEEVVRPADAKLKAANMFNKPEAGKEFVMVLVGVGMPKGVERSKTIYDSDFQVVGKKNIVYERAWGIVLDEKFETVELYGGGVSGGWLVYEVFKHDSDLKLRYQPFLGEELWLALE